MANTNSYWDMLKQQDDTFGDYGNFLTADSVTRNVDPLRQGMKTGGFDFDKFDYNSLSNNRTGLSGLLSNTTKSVSEDLLNPKDQSWWDKSGKWMGDKGNQMLVGAGLQAGQLGLGLASYLSQAPVLESQNKLLKQQVAINQENRDWHNKQRAGWQNYNNNSNVTSNA